MRSINSTLLALLFSATVMGIASGETLLWKDIFDVAGGNAGSFDAAPLAGRLSGTLAADVVARADGTQQQIVNNQLRLINNRIRFQVPPNGVRYDWAAGAGAAAIAADGGIQISFDWVPVNNTDTNWINVSVGFPLEFTGQRITAGDTDYGVLLRNNGGSQRFDNGANLGNGGTFPAILTSRHVEYNYAFSSFADGTTVRSKVTVDGVQVAADTFTWDGNGGTFAWVLETHVNGHSIDNLTFSTVPLFFETVLDETVFASGIPSGAVVGTVSGTTFPFGAESATGALVAGAGDTDNAKFQIVGNELRSSGTHDFTADPDGTQYSVRVQGTGGTTGGTSEQVYVLTLVDDDDLDGLPDPYELFWAGNLTSLSGDGVADFDVDGLTDLAEYNLSLGAYPTINPTVADTDGDTLLDGEEVNGTAGLRPVTNPVVADTDLDGLSDGAESNTGSFVSVGDTGTNPTTPDTDGDGSRDSWEIVVGGDALDGASFPPSTSANVKLVRLTGDLSSGVNSAKTYTHAISGGSATAVNGVNFDLLDGGTTPADFVWNTFTFTKNQIPSNNGDWVPATGGVGGPGISSLLNSFTYSGNGGGPNGVQRFTLSGLTPGEDYILCLYMRVWDTEGTGRPVDFTFTNGAEVVTPFGALPEDRPGTVLGNGNDHSAYCLQFCYQAQGTELQIDASKHASVEAVSGSYHMYGLSNEVDGGPNTDGDVMDDLVEVAYGFDPAVFESPGSLAISGGVITSHGLPTTVVENILNGVDYSIIYPRRDDLAAQGLSIEVRFSHDLISWFPGDAGTVVATGPGLEAVKVQYPFFLPNGRKARFAQVHVTRNQ